MKINNIKLIVVDLDGTLLKDDKSIDNVNIEVIKQLKSQGILFGIASGRGIHTIIENLEKWPISGYVDYVIGSNGSEIYCCDNDEYIDVNHLSNEFIKSFEKKYHDRNFATTIYSGIDLLCNKITETVESNIAIYNMKTILTDFQQFDKSASKLLLISKEEDQSDIYNDLKDNKEYNIFASNNVYLEVVDPNVNKSNGIKIIANKLGINNDNILTFGDAMNDYEMIRDYIGVAMKKSIQEIYDISKYTTDYSNNESGVGNFIKDYIF